MYRRPEHAFEGWRRARWRKHPTGQHVRRAPGRRGFTLLELAVALGVFVTFAVAIATVTISATSTHSQLRVQNNAVSALDSALSATVSESGYQALAVGEITVATAQRTLCEPGAADCSLTRAERAALAACLGANPATLPPNEGCVLYGNNALRVAYTAVAQQRPLLDSDDTYVGSVRLVAEGFLPSGRAVRASRTVSSPALGAAGDSGYVEVVLAGDLDGMYSQNVAAGTTIVPLVPLVRLVAGDGTTVLAQRSLDRQERPNRVLLRLDAAELYCTRQAPCQVRIDAGSYRISDQFTQRGGNRVIVDKGATARTVIQLTTGPGLRVRLDTRPARDLELARAPELGSVCLWGSFPHPEDDEVVVTSWCNLNNPFEVEIRGWFDTDDNGQPVPRELPDSAGDNDGILLWINPPVPPPAGESGEGGGPAPLRLVDCTPGATPGNGITTDERMRAYDAVLGWTTLETCTGWTWGMPSTLAYSEFNEIPFVEGAIRIPVYASVDRRVTLWWSTVGGGPAAGCSASDPAWSYPRPSPAPLDWDPAGEAAANCLTLLGELSAAPQWVDRTLSPFVYQLFYSDRVLAAGVPAPTYTVSFGALPPGIVLNSATGTITGVPSTPGSYQFTITASSGTATISETFDVVVANPLD